MHSDLLTWFIGTALSMTALLGGALQYLLAQARSRTDDKLNALEQRLTACLADLRELRARVDSDTVRTDHYDQQTDKINDQLAEIFDRINALSQSLNQLIGELRARSHGGA